jgi:Holliday junction resolvase RusA-like endonuclease
MQLSFLELPVGAREPDLVLMLDWPGSAQHGYWLNVFPPKVAEMAAKQAELGWGGEYYRWLQKSIKRIRKPNAKTQTYIEATAWQIKGQTRGFRLGDARLAAQAIFCPPTNGDWDLGSREKHVFDALKLSGVIDDDKQFDALLTLRGEKTEGGSVKLMLWRL